MKYISFHIARIICAAIMLLAALGKFTGGHVDVQIFTELGMEPYGRFIIGLVELGAALLLLSASWAHLGAILAFGVMMGALIAHITVLGFDVLHTLLLSAVLLTAIFVMFVRRQQLPLIGETFKGS